ncbi:MAG TPA: autotransporter-associated beta strand repeat-containing protein, partial [Pirellulales bacterium]
MRTKTLCEALRVAATYAAIVGTLLVGTPGTTLATIYTWTDSNGTSSWSDSLDWSPNGTPGTGDTANFGGSGSGTVTVVGTQLLKGLQFLNSADPFTITGGTFLYDNGGLLTVASGASGAESVFSSINFGAANGGSLLMQSDSRLGLLIGGNLNGTAGVGFADTLSLAGISGGLGTVSGLIGDSVNGGLVALSKTGAGTWTLSNSGNTYSGGTTISGGTLAIDNAGDLGLGGLAITNNSTLAFAPAQAAYTGNSTPGLSYAPGITLGSAGLSGGTFDVPYGTVETLSGVISGLGGLTKTDGGSLVLANSGNSFAGLISVNGGSLVINSASALGTASSSSSYTIAVNGASAGGYPDVGGGTLVLAGGQAAAQNITLGANMYLSGTGNSANSGTVGGAALLSIGNNAVTGTLYLPTDGTTGGSSSAGISSGFGTLTIGTPGSSIYMDTASATQTDEWIAGNGNVIIAGNIVGNTRLRADSRGGTLILTGDNAATWGVGGGTTSGGGIVIQSNTRVSDVSQLGALMSNNENLYLDGGVLEIRSDTPGSFASTGTYIGASITGYVDVDRAVGGSGLNGNVILDNFTWGVNGSLQLNGYDGYGLTVGTLGSTFDVSGSGSNGITNNSSGLLNIQESFRIGQNTADRTLSFTGSGDIQMQGNLLANTGTGTTLLTITKTGTGTVTIAGMGGGSDPAAGAFNINGGTLAINAFGGIDTNVVNIGTLAIAGALNYLGDPVTGNGETTSTLINLAGTTANSFLLANETGATGLTIAGTISAGGAGAKTLYLGGSSTAANTIQGPIQDSTSSTSITKIGTGTWILAPTQRSYLATAPTGIKGSGAASQYVITVNSTAGLAIGETVSGTNVPAGAVITGINVNGSNTITLNLPVGTTAVAANTSLTFGDITNFSGNVIVAGGTLGLQATYSGADIINDGSTITFSSDPITGSGTAGGTLQYQGFSGGSSELVGQLILSAGAATVQVTGGTDTLGAGSTLTFDSLGARSAGATIDFQPGTGSIAFTTAPTPVNGLLDSLAYATFNGTDWATVSGNNVAAYTGYTLGLPNSGSDATANYFLTGSQTTTAAESINTLKLTASAPGDSLTLAPGILTVAAQGVLFDDSNGAYSIVGTNGTSQLGASGTETIIIINGSNPANALEIDTLIGSGAGSLTMSGTGTLIIGGANKYTGNTVINGGVLQLSGATATLGVPANASTATLLPGTTLDLNGAGGGTTTIGGLYGAGTITNSGGGIGTASTLVIGAATSATAAGVFTGILQDGSGVGAGMLSVTKNTTGTQVFSGLNTYTGVTTINKGTLSVTSLANGGVASGIGASTSDASNLVLNGGSLQYTGSQATYEQSTATPSVSTDRLFTLGTSGGTIDSSGSFGNNVDAAGTANNAALIFSNTGPVVFSGSGARTLTLTGTSISDNEMAPLLSDPSTGALSLTKSGVGTWILSNDNTYSGKTTITAGQLNAVDGVGLPTTSELVISGGVLESNGTFTRSLGTAAGNVDFTTTGGFSANGNGPLLVNIGGDATPDTLTWGETAFLPTGKALILNSTSALSEVQILNSLALGSAGQTITVNDNTTTTTDYATIVGAISGGPASGTGLLKNGNGTLDLVGANSYTGDTQISAGTLVVTSMGGTSAVTTATTSSLGASGGTSVGTLLLGNAS